MNKKCTFSPSTRGEPSKSHERGKKPTRSSLNAVAVTLEKKKQCNSKALQIVTDFSEGTISEDNLIKSLEFISQDHYQDITEERAISKLCGYPLCSKKLKDIPAKQYHISTTHNKVFDITDRKVSEENENFCSNLCYKASKYLKDQVSTSPLWLRENHSSTNYKLISLQSDGGIVGDEVDLGHTPIKLDSSEIVSSHNASNVTKLNQDSNLRLQQELITPHYPVSNVPSEGCIDSKDDHMSLLHNLSNESVNNSIPEPSSENDPTNLVLSNLIETPKAVFPDENQLKSEYFEHGSNIEETQFNINKSSLNKGSDSTKSIHEGISSKATTVIDSNVPSSQTVISKHHKGSSRRNIDNKKKQSILSAMQNVVIKIEQVLKEWFSIDSICLIFGEDKIKEMLAEKKNYIGSISMDTHFYERYLAICRKLNILELEDTKVDASFKEEVKKPLPDYESLKKEAKTLDLKVKMFYKGDKLVQFEERDSISGENCVQEPILPLVDLHSQKAQRRRIVFDKLGRILQDLQKSLGLRCFNLNEDVRILISTFTLSAHNITMKPAEWNLIAIILIKLLSIRNKNLELALKSNSTDKHLTLLLMSYSLDAAYLDRLVIWLTDIESLLRKS